MKIILLRDNFAAAMRLAQNGVSSRSVLPALQCVRLTAQDASAITLTATDLEHVVVARLGARVTQLGDVLLPADMMNSLIGRLEDEKVALELLVKSGTVRVTSGKVTVNVKVLPPDEFPQVGDIPTDGGPSAGSGQAMTLDTGAFKNAITAVLPCVSGDSSRPALAGVYFEFREGRLVLAAADGFRLAECSLPADAPADWIGMGAIVPAKALQTLIKAIGKAERLTVGLDGQRVTFNMPHAAVGAQQLEANFPDYTNIIPKSHKLRATLEGNALLNAVKTTTIVGATGVFAFEPGEETGKLTLSTTDPERGDATVDIDGAITGEAITTGVNLPFVQDAIAGLLAAGATNVTLDTKSPNSPLRFTPAATTNHVSALYIVMPMQISGPQNNGAAAPPAGAGAAEPESASKEPNPAGEAPANGGGNGAAEPVTEAPVADAGNGAAEPTPADAEPVA